MSRKKTVSVYDCVSPLYFFFLLKEKRKKKVQEQLIPIQRTCPRFPGNCSAHRALDFLRKSLGLEKPNLNPSAAA
jgi:hypothetical protein